MFRRDCELKRVMILTGRTDMRKGMDSLIALIRLNYGLEPLEKGTLFLFCGIKKDKIKAICFEGDGFTLMTKRLTRGRYPWPNDPDEARALSMDEYDRFMDGFSIESTIKNVKRHDQK